MYSKLSAFEKRVNLSQAGYWHEVTSFQRAKNAQRAKTVKGGTWKFDRASKRRNVRIISPQAIASDVSTTKGAPSSFTDDEKMLPNYVPVYVMLPFGLWCMGISFRSTETT